MKRLALFLDGTWNNVDDNTNVWRLRSLLAEQGADGVAQRAYYAAGVGTARGEKFSGGTLGYGLSEEVIAAYRWLIENYDSGDEIFVFGFSRGAFTARSLTGLIATCGLLRPGAPVSVGQVYARYRRHKDALPIYRIKYLRDHPDPQAPLGEDDLRLLQYSFRVPIRMIGVWDTVGALGVPFGRIRGLSRQTFYFHSTNLSSIYENAFHAIAIDEHRHAFRETLWTRFSKQPPAAGAAAPATPGQAVEQRWFVGAHSNVGGGIVGDLLAQVPLDWLRRKAEGLGLAFRFPVMLGGDEQLGPIADSFATFMAGLYRIVRLGIRYYRVIGGPVRTVKGGYSESINETIDGSVFDRWRRDAAYRPPSLRTWAAAKGVDPGGLTGTVCAGTGTPIAAG